MDDGRLSVLEVNPATRKFKQNSNRTSGSDFLAANERVVWSINRSYRRSTPRRTSRLALGIPYNAENSPTCGSGSIYSSALHFFIPKGIIGLVWLSHVV